MVVVDQQGKEDSKTSDKDITMEKEYSEYNIIQNQDFHEKKSFKISEDGNERKAKKI